MKDTKPKPKQSKFQTREPAKPLVQPHTPPPNDHPIFNLVGPAIEAQSQPTPPTPRTPPTPPTPPIEITHPVSPERDFTKVPNSVSRDVVPAGHFVGKSKQLYDCLYQRTRGAILPTRRLAISKPELMDASGIGSERTLLKNLNHLKNIGLVRVTYTDGGHEGNTYEVFTPEEVGLRTPPTPPTPRHPRHARVELPPVPPVESGVGGVGSEPLESTTSGPPKTFIKDYINTDDDERVPRPLANAERELTGKNAPADKWIEVWEVLVTELRIAAGRTTVSNVSAFFAEHLRRRLWKTDKKQLSFDSEEQAAPGNAPEVDSKECPDCFGTGMCYPEGFDKGVARCRHEKLTSSSHPTP